MTTAADQINAMVANATSTAASKAAEASTYADQAVMAAATATTITTPDKVLAPVFAIPPFYPTTDLSQTFYKDWNDIWNQLQKWMDHMMNNWLTSFFPNIDPNIGPTEDAWLLNVVKNGYLGIPANVEDMMWQRARARDILEANRIEDEAITQFATRGFSFPAGVIANRVQVAQQEAANKSSTASRDIAIKNIDISINMTKFAIEEMTKLRLGIAHALAQYIDAWMKLPLAAAEIAKAKAEMQRFLWNSSADYIRALVDKARLELDADKFNSTMELDTNKIFLDFAARTTDSRVHAAMSAAEAMGRIASAAMAGQNTLAHISDATVTNA